MRHAFITLGIAAAGLTLAAINTWSGSPEPRLYATDASTQQLFILSTADGSASVVGEFGVPGYMADLTVRRPQSNTLWDDNGQ